MIIEKNKIISVDNYKEYCCCNVKKFVNVKRNLLTLLNLKKPKTVITYGPYEDSYESSKISIKDYFDRAYGDENYKLINNKIYKKAHIKVNLAENRVFEKFFETNKEMESFISSFVKKLNENNSNKFIEI